MHNIKQSSSLTICDILWYFPCSATVFKFFLMLMSNYWIDLVTHLGDICWKSEKYCLWNLSEWVSQTSCETWWGRISKNVLLHSRDLGECISRGPKWSGSCAVFPESERGMDRAPHVNRIGKVLWSGSPGKTDMPMRADSWRLDRNKEPLWVWHRERMTLRAD